MKQTEKYRNRTMRVTGIDFSDKLFVKLTDANSWIYVEFNNPLKQWVFRKLLEIIKIMVNSI